jgi:hypothetical protein
MTLAKMIANLRTEQAAILVKRNACSTRLQELRAAETTDVDLVAQVRAEKDGHDAALDDLEARIADLQAEQARDDETARLQATIESTETRKPAYNEVARVGAEKRTYSPDTDKGGKTFLRDVGLAFLGNYQAQDRLARHSQEEFVERGQDFTERAAGTGAFAGLVVPQYLTDMYAPSAKANRPFADAMNKHDLPPDGMTVNLSRITTGTSAAIQASENTGVSETNIDDTLLTLNVQTNSGQQTLSRQAIERGTGVEDAMLDDLFRAYSTTLDSTLLNQATNGLTNVAGASNTYVDATPTVAELYPKFAACLSAVEGVLLDQDPGDNIAVMHARRWYWLQNALGSTWPLMSQPGIVAQQGLTNYAERYGGGFRGVLPNGTAVVVDNNITTTAGGGTEDEIYIGSIREAHLWEDPNAPMMIRAEQTAAASLGVLFVVYGYFAYTFARYTGGWQKISGTGLIAPTFSGV